MIKDKIHVYIALCCVTM